MNLYKVFKTDKVLEQQGILVEYGTNSKEQPITFRVARAGGANASYNRQIEVKLKPYRKQIQTDSLERSILDRVVKDAFVEYVVLGWDGVEDEAGNPLPYSKENASKLFTDLPDLYADIQEQSLKWVLFRQDVNEGDAKNL